MKLSDFYNGQMANLRGFYQSRRDATSGFIERIIQRAGDLIEREYETHFIRGDGFDIISRHRDLEYAIIVGIDNNMTPDDNNPLVVIDKIFDIQIRRQTVNMKYVLGRIDPEKIIRWRKWNEEYIHRQRENQPSAEALEHMIGLDYTGILDELRNPNPQGMKP